VGYPLLTGKGCGALCPSQENFSLLTLKKAHFGGYLMNSDVPILKLWFAMHRMLQDCATDSVSISPTGYSSWGLVPLVPDKLHLCLSPFSSPFLFLSLSFLAKLTRCLYAAAYTPQPFYTYDTFGFRSFERLLKPTIMYLQSMSRDSHCYIFCHVPEKWGYGTPLQKVGVCLYPPKVMPMNTRVPAHHSQGKQL